jgi:integrase
MKKAGTICPHVFHRNGRRIKSLRKSWADACEAAGYPGKLLHDLRRSAVRNMERAGLSRSVAMQLTGHKTEAVYRRYAITSEADLREGVERLNRSIPRRTTQAS